MNQYHSSCDFDFFVADRKLWSTLSGLIEAIPSAIVTGSKAPALLRFINTLSKHPETVSIVSQEAKVVQAVILCASRKCDHSSVALIVETLSHLLDFENGKYLKPYVEVLDAFMRIFVLFFTFNFVFCSS